jgi:hypothetical protein
VASPGIALVGLSHGSPSRVAMQGDLSWLARRDRDDTPRQEKDGWLPLEAAGWPPSGVMQVMPS